MKKYVFYVDNKFDLITKSIFETAKKLNIPCFSLQIETRYGLDRFCNYLEKVKMKDYTPVIIGGTNALDFKCFYDYTIIRSDDNLLEGVKKFLNLEMTERDKIISDYTYKGLREILKNGVSIPEAEEIREEAFHEMRSCDQLSIKHCNYLVTTQGYDQEMIYIKDFKFIDRILIDSIDLFRHKQKREIDAFYTTCSDKKEIRLTFYGNPEVTEYIISLPKITTIKHDPKKPDFWSGYISHTDVQAILGYSRKLSKGKTTMAAI